MMIYTIHAPTDEHLTKVKAEMAKLGSPSIRVVDCGDHYMALEGTHRIAAAHALGIKPELIIYQQDDDIDITVFDWFDTANWTEIIYPAGEVAGELYSMQAQGYQF